jgi:hypothetical protein
MATEKRNHRIVLICGQSNSGKTSAAKRELDEVDGKVHVISNNHTDDFKEAKYCKGGFDVCHGLSNCAVFFDDVISCKKLEFEAIQKLVNFSGHHSNIGPIFIACHSVMHNNLFALLEYLTHVWFTLAKSNVRSLESVLQFFKFDKEEKKNFSRTFLDDPDSFGIYELDVSKRTFGRIGKNWDPGTNQETMTKPVIPASRYLELIQPEKRRKEAALILDLIQTKIPEKMLAGGDFTLTLKNNSTGQNVSISLLDYVMSLTDEKCRPGKELISAHKVMCKYVTIPKCFVANKRFL